MLNLKPKDIVALVFIAFIFFYKWFRTDTAFDATLALVVGYYFGARVSGRDTGH